MDSSPSLPWLPNPPAMVLRASQKPWAVQTLLNHCYRKLSLPLCVPYMYQLSTGNLVSITEQQLALPRRSCATNQETTPLHDHGPGLAIFSILHPSLHKHALPGTEAGSRCQTEPRKADCGNKSMCWCLRGGMNQIYKVGPRSNSEEAGLNWRRSGEEGASCGESGERRSPTNRTTYTNNHGRKVFQTSKEREGPLGSAIMSSLT